VYAWKQADELARAITERGVYRADRIELRTLPLEVLDRIAATLERTNRWDLSVTGGTIYLTIAGELYETTLARIDVAS
jgi:uncharacterized protein YaeQ